MKEGGEDGMRHTSRTPTTLTDAEVKALLDATTRADGDLRDHMILSIALGTGLRVSELTALDVGDVQNGKGARGVWPLRAETTKGDRGGTVALPDRLRRKMSAYLRWKGERGESLDPHAPLFSSRGGGRGRKSGGGRLSVRGAQAIFESWQKRCGFDRRLHFHALRHSFCTNLWRATGDLRLVQQAARHSSPSTTSIYTHATTEDVLAAVQKLPC
jgi:site-specific recombinase XerD